MISSALTKSAAGIAAAFAVLAGAGVANASPTPSPSGSSSERVEVSLAAVDETPALTSASSPFRPGKLVTMNRTSTCQWVKATAVVYKNRAVVGRAPSA
ncbi:hypothetical protein [Streptomyces sp. FBKL.4005]|uniref:hypothetical protein n=1 Tax=Streptomyces sp. FBKL.4005 TaxID=2015515 RepID=UPI00117F64E0|nr:hypothetical protein [Streptomyces sp. FBKL.4005]